MKVWKGFILYWSACLLLLTGILIGFTSWLGEGEIGVDFAASAGLAGINFALFVGISYLWQRDQGQVQLIPGLLWVGGKLFVNTFTLFLLIGLQLVSIRVFVPTFFTLYFVILIMGVGRFIQPLPHNRDTETG